MDEGTSMTEKTWLDLWMTQVSLESNKLYMNKMGKCTKRRAGGCLCDGWTCVQRRCGFRLMIGLNGWTGMDRHKGCCGLGDRRKRGRDRLATIVKW